MPWPDLFEPATGSHFHVYSSMKMFWEASEDEPCLEGKALDRIGETDVNKRSLDEIKTQPGRA
jgi:hypothetical protein